MEYSIDEMKCIRKLSNTINNMLILQLDASQLKEEGRILDYIVHAEGKYAYLYVKERL